MYIIFLGDSLCTQNTGIHYYGMQLVKKIIQQFPENEYSIILPSRKPEFKIRQWIIPVKKWLPFHLRVRQLITIPALVNKLKPDAVIELAHFGPFFIAGRIKRITVIHDLTPVSHPQFHGALSVFMHRLLLPGILKRAHRIIVNSSNTKKDIIRMYGTGESKIKIVYPAMPDLSGKRQQSPQPLPAGIKKPYFLTVGTIEPRKNQITILKAFEQFCKVHRHYQLVIAGKKGWKHEGFYDHFRRSPCKDKIIITGYISREELLDLYSNAYAFVFASLYEGFGLPVLEAQSFGLPLILSRIDVMTEVAADAALYFDPLDHDGLARHMLLIVEDEGSRHALAESSLARFDQFQGLKQDFGSIFN